MGLCVFLLLFGAQFLCLVYLYYKAYTSEQAHVRSEVAQLALVASHFVDVEAHEQLTDPRQFDSERYQSLLAPLVRFHLASPDIHYLYTMRVDTEANEFFVLDTATDPKVEAMLLRLGRESEASGLMEPYEVPDSANTKELRAAMRSGQPYVYEDVYEDNYGSFVSAQAPLFDADGEYVGYLGVDFNLQAFDERMDSLRRSGAITFEIDLEPGILVRGDMMRLREAMDNLVSNAVKYSPLGGLIRVALEPVGSGQVVQFSVLDQGEGVNEADQAQLFKKFVKLTAKPTAGESSTGLGLSIVKTIVEKHGGTVGCRSQAGQGACFWIRLPLASSV